MSERHILGLSGGRDSAALAVYMRQHFPDLPIEYFFTDSHMIRGGQPLGTYAANFPQLAEMFARSSRYARSRAKSTRSS